MKMTFIAGGIKMSDRRKRMGYKINTQEVIAQNLDKN